MGTAWRAAIASVGGILVVCVAMGAWSADRMVSIGEYASDHGTSGAVGSWLWIPFLTALAVGCVALVTLVVMGEKGRRLRGSEESAGRQ